MSDEQRPTGDQPRTPDAPDPERFAPQAPAEVPHDGGQVDPVTPVDDPWLLDRVLSGEAGDSWAGVAELLRAASAPAEPHELRGERAAVSTFLARRHAGGRHASGHRSGAGARRVAVVSTLMAGKFAAVTVAGLVTLGAGGMAAAAYTGILPAPLQDVAHRTIGAPLPDRTSLRPPPTSTATPTPTPTPSEASSPAPRAAHSHRPSPSPSPSVRGPAARPVADLCAAWQRQLLPTTAAEFPVLSSAAGSLSVDEFCASLTTPTTAPTTSPTVEPTATPSVSPSPTESPSSPPATASDEPTSPPIAASDQPAPSPTGSAPADEPTGP